MKRKAKSRKATKKVVKKLQPIPKGYNVLTPYLAIRGAAAAP